MHTQSTAGLPRLVISHRRMANDHLWRGGEGQEGRGKRGGKGRGGAGGKGRGGAEGEGRGGEGQ